RLMAEALKGLRIAPEVEDRDLLHACDRTQGGACLLRRVFAANVFEGVLFERDRRVAALLRAIVNEPLLAYVEVAPTRSAAPVVGLTLCEVILKVIHARVAAFSDRLHLLEDAHLFFAERLEGSRSVMDDTARAREAQLDGAAPDRD